MAEDGESVAVEGDSEDRISGLPRNVVNCILELLPVRDAARTSILSRNWRYIWATLPKLVLTDCVCGNFTGKLTSNFIEAVDCILLLHMGDIVEFVLDARRAFTAYSSYAVIDRWILFVTRNRVKKLTLHISNDDTYTLPSSIFNCSTLTHLKLSNCVFKPPNPFLGLESLYFRDSHSYLVLDCFMNCKNIRHLDVEFNGVVDNPTNDKISNLEKLLVSSPALELLRLDSFFIELLSAHIVPNGQPFTLNCLRHLYLGVNFGKMGQISYALQLIKSSPNLSKLDILVRVTSYNADAILKYLDTPSCLERPLDKLEHIAIKFFKSSKAELLFVKLLLSRTPSLLKMCIYQLSDINVDIALELMRFPRASPRAELFYSQYKDDF